MKMNMSNGINMHKIYFKERKNGLKENENG